MKYIVIFRALHPAEEILAVCNTREDAEFYISLYPVKIRGNFLIKEQNQ